MDMAGDSSSPDRAKAVRVAPPVTVAVELPDTNQALAARIKDLSTKTIGIFVGEALEKGRKVKVRIVYPELEEGIDLMGAVTRVVPPPPVAKEWIVEVAFEKLTIEADIVLDRWVRHALSTMVRVRNQEKRRDFGLAGPGPDGIR